jgi:hypothetical protein
MLWPVRRNLTTSRCCGTACATHVPLAVAAGADGKFAFEGAIP